MSGAKCPRPSFRAANYERVQSPGHHSSQARAVITMLQALVEHFTARPEGLVSPESGLGVAAGSDTAMRAAVTYVAGVTELRLPEHGVKLGWDRSRLPSGSGQPARALGRGSFTWRPLALLLAAFVCGPGPGPWGRRWTWHGRWVVPRPPMVVFPLRALDGGSCSPMSNPNLHRLA